MTKPRALIKGDRVKITGPWNSEDSDDDGGKGHIGKFATVWNAGLPEEPMSIIINIDGVPGKRFFWDRENLKALPRKAQPDG